MNFHRFDDLNFTGTIYAHYEWLVDTGVVLGMERRLLTEGE